MPELMQAREPASGTHNGEPFVVNPSDFFAADHELVRSYPHLFKPVEANRPDVEQATAAPGEKRGRKRRESAEVR